MRIFSIVHKQCFFFFPWKRFFAVFLVFFTGRKFFSRVPFLKISRVGQTFHGYFFRFFHGLRFYFHGLKKGKKHGFLSISRLNLLIFSRPEIYVSRVGFLLIFHGKDFCFTGCFWEIFTGTTWFSRVENRFFSRVPKNFSRGKKNTDLYYITK